MITALDARERIRAGALRGAALLAAIRAVPFDARDAWVDTALEIESAPDDQAGLPLGTVPYVPCGVDAIVRAVSDAPIGGDDVFVDLGAGLGRVALLVHLLTGARARGVELQQALVAQADAAIRRVGAQASVRIVCGGATDARAYDAGGCGDGTVFFIYASFGPQALARVIARVEEVARARRVVLCAIGFELRVPWLRARASSSPELVLYDSEWS